MSGGALTSSLINRLQDNRSAPIDATRMAELTGAVANYNKAASFSGYARPQDPQFSGPSVTLNIPDSKVPAAKQQKDWQTNNLPPSARGLTTVITSSDPNSKTCSGWGAPGFVSPAEPILYGIEFENQPTASAPAQQVTITDQLSTNLDWSTLQLQSIGFNNQILVVPDGLDDYAAWASVTTDPNPVAVTASFDPGTGLLTWTMSSIDPVTGQLVEDPMAGFLPPNTTNGIGEGYVTYTVRPRNSLANGTVITNQANIVFDVNAPILTPVVTNTIDSVSPHSTMQPLPATETNAQFTVQWSGSDATGSGVASYDIYVSTNGGPWTLWLAATTNTSALFTGQTYTSYAFYSVAVDELENMEAAPIIPGAHTAVLGYKLTVSASPGAGGTVSGGGTFVPGGSHTVTATASKRLCIRQLD